MPEINEWTFASDICKTIQGIIAENPSLPFSEAKVEQGSKTGRKRRDLTLYDRESKPVLTGEIKLPDRPDGQSPYAAPLVDDAFDKANARGVEHFFTWNVNRFVLWKTFEAGKLIAERDLEHFNVTSITRSEELSNPGVQTEIRGFLTQFLGRYARIIEGTEPIRSRPLDEKFIRVLESALELPILQTGNSVSGRYSQERRFARDIDAWMRDSQGWLISTDPKILRDNLERAAKFSCYVLANKIVFQQALRRRFPSLRKIRIPESVKTAARLQETLHAAFDEAKRVSHDYETVFDGDFGDSLPFLEDVTVSSWREFVAEIEGFDFGKIGYDIIGHIFERLISPEERHRYGQHYTRSEIVDLINAFTIREAGAIVLDPSCGGGTFLVRAYILKRELSGGSLAHVDLLQQIKGIDLSAYAAHLSTINLATRDLIDERNYPLVARSDFFNVKRGEAVFHVPMSVQGKGKQTVPLEIGEVDCIVGNPPYVRQELLSSQYKKLLTGLVEIEFPDAKLSGRSDLHCYFWPHASSFLKEGGHYGFLTSSAWLDVEYGFHLQEWVLRHFAILALFESNCEPWFTGARVTTVATLMRREADPAKRAANTVRFVQLRQPLSEILVSFDRDPLRAARLLRDFVESVDENVVDDRWRIRVVNQHELWKVGCTGGVAGVAPGGTRPDPIGSPAEIQDADLNGATFFQGEYAGGKWGIYLRAPDIFFKLLDRCVSRLVPLGQLAEIRRGITSGADDFFYLRDTTEDEISKCSTGLQAGSPQIAQRFKYKWAMSLGRAKHVRICESGDRSRHLIEAKYLEPEIHSLMEIDAIEIDPAKLSRKILLVSDPPEKLRGTHVLKYIKWGEREGFDQGSTVGQRAASRPWYDLTHLTRARLLWQKTHKYRHISPLNSGMLPANCRLYTLQPSGVTENAFAGALNSTVVAMTKGLYGRFYGTEGTLDTEIVDCQSMLVPDLRETSKRLLRQLETWIEANKSEPVGHLREELLKPSREQLDLLVLEALGLQDKEERRILCKELHRAMRTLHREYRDVELKANINKRITARQNHASPHTLADEIWEEFDKTQLRAFPADFVPDSEPAETVTLPAGKPKVIDDLFHRGGLQINGNVINLGSKTRAEFAAQVVELSHYGATPIPKSDRACGKALEGYRRYEAQIEAKFSELAQERSADPDTQSRIVRELWKLALAGSRHD